ncbi:Squalene/phytoene synthase family protein [Penicillium ucsense]|uniref:Squalene/phytoene synthase family protein n=1 Tax=Penicillium ucsense TaxID=2839758 RepID=A0A8J8WMI5_9EURO|nr:Squalene/phytoene synthase family protein [Penicillium ucsense]KAF7739380.1 Squalene/phytoene synthase family protein [Penicillium ucsense]
MSLFRNIARPCRATRLCWFSRQNQWPHSRGFSRTTPVGATPTPEEVQGAHRYCVSLLSKYDRPSYTLSTFIPQHARSFYIALRALNVSLSMIPETTSSPTIGLMRLQFWRDAVTKILAGSPPKEPVAILLASAISDLHERTQGRAKITRGWLTRLINAREQTLTNDPYPNIAALESYAENTYSTLMYLTLGALPMTSVTADHVASHIGKAVGIAAVLRGLPLVAFPPPSPQSPSGPPGMNGGVKQGAVMLPLDIMAQNGVKEEEVLRRGADAEGLRDAVFAVATRASDHLITVDQMLSNLRAGKDVGHDFEHEGEEGHEYQNTAMGESRGNESPLDEVNRAFGVFMPAVATRLWLERLQQYDFDVFRPELLSGDWRLPWKAYTAFRRKNIG